VRKGIADFVAVSSQSALSGGCRAVDLETGDRVHVNLAPFIGAAVRCRDSILCTVLAVDHQQVQVMTEPPYRELVMWVASSWIEDRAKKKRPLPHFAGAGPSGVDTW
jgi:hypothetical protein